MNLTVSETSLTLVLHGPLGAVTWLVRRHVDGRQVVPVDLGSHHFLPPPTASALLRYPYCRFAPTGTCWYMGSARAAHDLLVLYRAHGFPAVAVDLAEHYAHQFGALPPEEATAYEPVAVEQAIAIWLG